MAINYLANKPGKTVTIHVSAANGSIVVAGNNSVSNIAVGTENVVSGYIRQVIWGTDAGSIQIKRNSNLVATFTGADSINYAEKALPLTINPTANIDVQFIGSSNGYVVIEVQKNF